MKMAPPMPDLKNIKLPKLSAGLQLFSVGNDLSGAPKWRIYNPLPHKYYQLSWAEFECVSRFQDCKTAGELKEKVESETTLTLEDNDIIALISFLNKNGLLSSADAMSGEFIAPKRQPLWKKLVHHYLFFTIPLVKPERFLRRTLPLVRPLLSRNIFVFSMLIMVFSLILTLARFDEFMHTFYGFFTMEGVITLFVVFFFIKILHELAHAYTAHKYGVAVPHMGVAFMVMYPILYTETTKAWSLQSRRQRMEIGLAGIRIELILAAFALMLWNFLPAGTLQSLTFSIVAISLIGSLAINLNPLMRFDGYFVLSDYLGIENLHAKGFENARWWLRKTLFGLPDHPPEHNFQRRRFLIGFGLATLMYRFFLFLGIALLVYHLFFKPLGLFLMVIELLWFIILPLLSELKIWWVRRRDIMAQKRGRIMAVCLAIFVLFSLIPSSTSIQIPAMLHHTEQRNLYPPAPSRIETLHVQNGQFVEKGAPLVTLSSIELDKELARAQTRLEMLLAEKRQLQSNPALAKDRRALIDTEINAGREALSIIEARKDNLNVIAPFTGIVRDLDAGFHAGMTISQSAMLLRLINPDELTITAYVTQNEARRLNETIHGTFRPDFSLRASHSFEAGQVDPVNAAQIDWQALSSVYGGSIASEFSPQNDRSDLRPIIPRQSIYKITLGSVKVENKDISAHTALRGQVNIEVKSSSPFLDFFNKAYDLIQREINLN